MDLIKFEGGRKTLASFPNTCPHVTPPKMFAANSKSLAPRCCTEYDNGEFSDMFILTYICKIVVCYYRVCAKLEIMSLSLSKSGCDFAELKKYIDKEKLNK